MGRKRRTSCRICGATDRPLSGRGTCPPCITERVTAGAVELRNKSGPVWDAYVAAKRKQLERELAALDHDT